MYLTGSCNLKCRHCWINPHFEKNAGKCLPWNELKKIIQDAKEIGLSSVKLTGGEPFLHPEILGVIKGLKEMKLGVTIETNGTLIDEEAPELRGTLEIDIIECRDTLDCNLRQILYTDKSSKDGKNGIRIFSS